MTKSQMLDWLIKTLSPATPLPSGTDEKWRLFRAIVNTRQPQPVSPQFLQVQNELLQLLITEKGITDAADLPAEHGNLTLWRGDITTLRAGAVVNAANSGMLGCFVPGHHCIDNAIHTYAGVQLRLACADIMAKQGHPEPIGQVKITSAYNLPSQYILHTVGPAIIGKPTQEDVALLASCYRSCMEMAEMYGIVSVAFCCISTGVFRFPNEQAAEIAVETVKQFTAERQSKVKVIFNVFKDKDYDIYKRILNTNK